jgi:uncharacterized protein YciI
MPGTRRAVFAGGVAMALAGAAQAQGPAAPREDLYVIVYRKGPSWRAGEPMTRQDLREHGLYMRDLAARGVILTAGPLLAVDGGMVVFHAPSPEAAAAVMAADPAVKAGVFVGEVSPWAPLVDPGARFQQAR